MYATKVDSIQILYDLKTNKINLVEYINEICHFISQNDVRIHSLIPEPGRRKRLLRDAEILQKRYPNLSKRPPLYGMLVGVKDVIRVNGFPTKAGSQLPARVFEGPEADVVTQLVQAGALIIGKTVTTEFAFAGPPGPTLNPHHLEHTPGGSSSGSAAAVAAGFCPLALGTQTGGSTIRPAAFCGVIGYKPSFGRISTNGLIHLARSLDHVGLFTQSIEILQLTLPFVCNNWRESRQSHSGKITIGVPEGNYMERVSQESKTIYESQLEALENSGFGIKKVSILEDIETINHLHSDLLIYEMAQEHRNWFNQYKSLYSPETRSAVVNGRQISVERAEKARRLSIELRQDLEKVMNENNIDLWASPSALGFAPKGITSTGDAFMNMPWTNAGLPTISLPVSKASNGLPIGLQLAARYMKDEQLIFYAERILKVLSDN